LKGLTNIFKRASTSKTAKNNKIFRRSVEYVRSISKTYSMTYARWPQVVSLAIHLTLIMKPEVFYILSALKNEKAGEDSGSTQISEY